MHTYWTSMFWSIDSCQNRVPADQYHLTVSRAQGSTHRGQVFFKVIRWQVTSFQMIAGSSLIFFKFIWNMLCLCPAQLRFWFQTDLGRKNSASYYRQGRQLLWTLLSMVTLYFQFLCSDWSKFDRWVHAKNLCIILNQLLSGVFCYSWLTGFWLKNTPLVKVGNPILDGIVLIVRHINTIYVIWILKKIKLEPGIIWKLVTCHRITSKNTWLRWVDTWARETLKWYWSADTLFWQLCSQTS